MTEHEEMEKVTVVMTKGELGLLSDGFGVFAMMVQAGRMLQREDVESASERAGIATLMAVQIADDYGQDVGWNVTKMLKDNACGQNFRIGEQGDGGEGEDVGSLGE